MADEYRDLDVGLTRINLPDGGSIEPVTAAARSKDGGKETFVVADEVHLWTTPELHSLYATVTRNITKRRIADGWLMSTSTMYGPGEGSVAESIHAAAKAKKMQGLLWDHREAPADLDITNDDELRKGLEYVYGAAAPWTNIDAIVAEFHDPTKTESDNRRYWLNQPAQRADRLFDPLQHKVLERPGLRPADGTTIVMGFDGSENRDSTALIGWTVEDVPHRFTIGLWERPRGVCSSTTSCVAITPPGSGTVIVIATVNGQSSLPNAPANQAFTYTVTPPVVVFVHGINFVM